MPQESLVRRSAASTSQGCIRLNRLSELISYRISVLNRAFEQEAGRNVAKEHRLSLTEVRVLGILDELSPTTVKHLASVMRLKRPQVSRALALLQEQNLVGARPNLTDGRSTDYAITKKGRRRARKVLEVASFYHHDRLAALSAEERKALDSALDKLLARSIEVADDL